MYLYIYSISNLEVHILGKYFVIRGFSDFVVGVTIPSKMTIFLDLGDVLV